jgi:hypothetical protein
MAAINRPGLPWLLSFLACICVLVVGCAAIPKHLPPTIYGQHRLNVFDPPDNRRISNWVRLDSPDFSGRPAIKITDPSDYIAFSRERCGGRLGILFGEWKAVEPRPRPPMQLIRGRALASEFAGADFWGTHRNADWSIYLQLDASFDALLAPANRYDWEDDPVVQDLQTRSANPGLMRLIELEWDSRFFPPQMAPEPGDEVLAIGRWVFDCGHEGRPKGRAENGYRTEIHPFALVLTSHVAEERESMVRTIFKVFSASRGGPVNATPLMPLLKFWSSQTSPLGGENYVFELGPAEPGWRVTSCELQAASHTSGHRRIFDAVVGTSNEGTVIQLTVPAASYHPSDRIESGIIIATTWVKGGTLAPTEGVTCK